MKVGQSIQHKKPNQDDNLIPLINIVFLMLIFFMVAGHISESDPIKVQAPSSISDKQDKLEPMVIVVAADGRWRMLNWKDNSMSDLTLPGTSRPSVYWSRLMRICR